MPPKPTSRRVVHLHPDDDPAPAAATPEQVDRFVRATGLPAGAYGLYRQVLEAPTNVGYRELLADWMDEYGPQPVGALHADFVRIQIALAGPAASKPRLKREDRREVLDHERNLFDRGAVLTTPGQVLTALVDPDVGVEWSPGADIDGYPGTVAQVVVHGGAGLRGHPVTFRCLLGNVDWVTSTLSWWERMGPTVVAHYPVFQYTPLLVNPRPEDLSLANEAAVSPLHLSVLKDRDPLSGREDPQPHHYAINWDKPTRNWTPADLLAWTPLRRLPFVHHVWPWAVSRLTNDIPHRYNTLAGLYHAVSWLQVSWAREQVNLEPLPLPADFEKDVPEEISDLMMDVWNGEPGDKVPAVDLVWPDTSDDDVEDSEEEEDGEYDADDGYYSRYDR